MIPAAVSIKTFALSLTLLAALSGCGRQTVLVVTASHIDAAGQWPPSTAGFARRAALAGFRVSVQAAAEPMPLAELLAEVDPVPDILILSPWNRFDTPPPLFQETRIIIAGAAPPPGAAENITGLAPDFSDALRQAGRIAGEMALKEDKPAILLADRDLPALKEAYREAAGEALPLIEVLQDENRSADIPPEDFTLQAEESSLLLLFAGGLNLAAYDAGADLGIPVITEFALSGGRWENRIIASIEENQPAMAKKLIAVMKDDIHLPVVYYPASLEK